jgi:hypothetical protein
MRSCEISGIGPQSPLDQHGYSRTLQLLSRKMTQRPRSLSAEITRQTGGAMPVVVPALIVADGVTTDPIHWNAYLLCRDNLMHNDAQSRRAQIALNARFGDDQQPQKLTLSQT